MAATAAVGQDESAAQRLLDEGRLHKRNGNPDAALGEYRALVERFPTSRFAPTALLESAQIHFQANRPDRAEAESQRLIDGYVDSVESAAARVLQARVKLAASQSLADLEAARTLLARVANLYGPDRFGLLPARAEARVLGAQASATLGDRGAALSGFLEAMEDEPRGPWTQHAELGMAQTLLAGGEWLPAVQLLQAVVERSDSTGAADVVAQARTLLTAIHRMWIRPAASQPRWTTARRLNLPTLRKPGALAASLKGRVVVGDEASSNLVTIATDGTMATTAATATSKNLGRPWFDPDDRVMVSVAEGVLAESGGRAQTLTSGGDKPKPLGRILAGASGLFGQWFIIDKDLDGVHVFAGGEHRSSLGAASVGAVDVATGADGTVYVLNARPSKVAVFGPSNQLIRSFSSTAEKPLAIDVDALGNVYVLDSGRRAIVVTSSEGAGLQTLGPLLPGGLELRSPEDLAVDGTGRIYVADPKLAVVVVLE